MIGVIGASGNVGRIVVALLLERAIVRPEQLRLFASAESAGQSLAINGVHFTLEDAESSDFSGIDCVIFNTEGPISAVLVPKALAAGAYVIDSSAHYRLDPSVPLIVPPVNAHLMSVKQKLYAHANCLSSPIATVLAPLHHAYPIERINIVTYQATSGAGKKALDECWQETAAVLRAEPYTRTQFKRPIAFNVIPQVGTLGPDGATSEEYKIIQELRKIIDPAIAIAAMAVRVPVLRGHSVALNVAFKNALDWDHDWDALIGCLAAAPFVSLSTDQYHTPVEVVDSDQVFVGRIRRDPSVAHGLQLWLCSDNLRRGAATDAVEMLEVLLSLCQERQTL